MELQGDKDYRPKSCVEDLVSQLHSLMVEDNSLNDIESHRQRCGVICPIIELLVQDDENKLQKLGIGESDRLKLKIESKRNQNELQDDEDCRPKSCIEVLVSQLHSLKMEDNSLNDVESYLRRCNFTRPIIEKYLQENEKMPQKLGIGESDKLKLQIESKRYQNSSSAVAHNSSSKPPKKKMPPVMHFTANAEPEIINVTERELPKDVFLKCKDQMRPVKKYLMRLNLEIFKERSEEERAKIFSHHVLKIGIKIAEILKSYTNLEEVKEWRRNLWIFASYFTKQNARQLYRIYRQAMSDHRHPERKKEDERTEKKSLYDNNNEEPKAKTGSGMPESTAKKPKKHKSEMMDNIFDDSEINEFILLHCCADDEEKKAFEERMKNSMKLLHEEISSLQLEKERLARRKQRFVKFMQKQRIKVRSCDKRKLSKLDIKRPQKEDGGVDSDDEGTALPDLE